MSSGSNESESSIQYKIRKRLGQMDDLVIWRNESGVAQHGKRYVRYGLCKGSSDVIGILKPHGRFIAIEIKKPGGRIRPEQVLFVELINSMGGYAEIVDSVIGAENAIKKARERYASRSR